ncbi:ribosome-binding protein 1-like [Sitodiplosis mosellana]|uniref:ribosome-binding protein 1-like n=1 Tax=Sitodiplosis mosellana TaxID=263140 RepID=UPI00244495A1|nr:ribosome-binding protein 1-like [Sitodiplosis mosellana]
MNFFTVFTLCVTIAVASAWPQRQFAGNPFFQNQPQQNGQFFPNQVGLPNQPQQNGQFFPNQGGFQNPNQGGQGFPNQGGFQNQGFPNQLGQNQGNFNQGGFQNQGSSNQFGQNQGQFRPNPNNPFLPQNTSPNPDITTVGTQGIVDQIFGRPNQSSNQPGQFTNPTQNQVTATTPAAAPAQSPAFLRCTREECLTTNEYNPVCGSDQQVYSNIRKLECANQCGRRLNQNWQEVRVLRSGACASGQRVS